MRNAVNVGDLPPTQLYASFAFALSVATLWFNVGVEDTRFCGCPAA